MNKYLLDAKLAHLSEPEVDFLVSRYYQGEKIAPLLAELKVQCRPQLFADILPFVIHADKKCPNCGAQMGVRMHSKSSYRQVQNMLECSHCEHSELPACRCIYCRKLEEDKEGNKQLKLEAMIQECCDSLVCKPSKKTAIELSFRTAVSLLALTRASDLSESGSYNHINSNAIPFAPKGEFCNTQCWHC